MPMKSPAQHNLMEGVAHNPAFAKKVGIKQSVGKDFVAAGDSFSGGGNMNKSYMGKRESFAEGGAVLGRTRDFIKEPDRFRGVPNPKPVKTADDYSDKASEPKGKDKSEKPVKPR